MKKSDTLPILEQPPPPHLGAVAMKCIVNGAQKLHSVSEKNAL